MPCCANRRGVFPPANRTAAAAAGAAAPSLTPSLGLPRRRLRAVQETGADGAVAPRRRRRHGAGRHSGGGGAPAGGPGAERVSGQRRASPAVGLLLLRTLVCHPATAARDGNNSLDAGRGSRGAPPPPDSSPAADWQPRHTCACGLPACQLQQAAWGMGSAGCMGCTSSIVGAPLTLPLTGPSLRAVPLSTHSLTLLPLCCSPRSLNA